MTVIILQTPAAKHQHLTATRVIASETVLRQKLAVMTMMPLLLAIFTWQWTWLNVLARHHMVSICTTLVNIRLLLTILVVVANDLANDRDTQNTHRNSCKVTISIPGSG
ncbi:MAG: hypothetical protein OTI35_05510 [Sulfitobacter sp.]|nr:hypothetical protein [Sulfitobacter sp.]